MTENAAPAATEICACGHPLATHDAVATRYCAATVSQQHDRKCICREAATGNVRHY